MSIATTPVVIILKKLILQKTPHHDDTGLLFKQ